MTVTELFRQQTREMMKEKGLTQEDLAKAIGVEQSYISKMLTGKIGNLPDSWVEVMKVLGAHAELVSDNA